MISGVCDDDRSVSCIIIHCDRRWVQDAIGWLPRNSNFSQYYMFELSNLSQ